jgi:uncharacterized repeat protein (TIGR03803 family)
VLYNFAGGNDGIGPTTGLVTDLTDNLYATTALGGQYNAGVVYQLTSPGGMESVIHAFNATVDGRSPTGVIADAARLRGGLGDYAMTELPRLVAYEKSLFAKLSVFAGAVV